VIAQKMQNVMSLMFLKIERRMQNFKEITMLKTQILPLFFIRDCAKNAKRGQNLVTFCIFFVITYKKWCQNLCPSFGFLLDFRKTRFYRIGNVFCASN